MKTYIHLSSAHRYTLPAAFQEDDVRYAESLVEHFLEQYTQKGDVVFDPFAGFGTTLFVAERMGRISYGIEINQDRVNFARSKLTYPEHLIQGDARLLATMDLPEIDFSMTSPPYMTKDNHPEFPFAGYTITGESYEEYLRDIRSIYEQLRARMKPIGTVVLEVANLKVAFDLMQRHPVLGVGPGNFPTEYVDPKYRYAPGRTLDPRALHNMYLGIIVETGWVGFACFAAFLGAALLGLREARRRIADPELRALAEATQFAFVGYLIAVATVPAQTAKHTWILIALAVVAGRADALAGQRAAADPAAAALPQDARPVPGHDRIAVNAQRNRDGTFTVAAPIMSVLLCPQVLRSRYPTGTRDK